MAWKYISQESIRNIVSVCQHDLPFRHITVMKKGDMASACYVDTASVTGIFIVAIPAMLHDL
eukprot:12939237-Prorocentrum_lima.AAC.1